MERRSTAREDEHLPSPGHARGGVGWPDWQGQDVAIIASGPSAKGQPFDLLKDRFRVLAVKENIELCPFADAVYGCDRAWWDHRKGLPEFRGLKICWEGNGLHGYPDIRRVKIAPGKGTKYSTRLEFDPGTVGAGGNSGFQALNLAVQWGARRIVLIGFDMTDRSGVHWYGRNRWPMSGNPDDSNFRRWIAAFHEAAPVLRGMGVEVVNASLNSALTCFPRHPLADIIKRWS